MNKKSGQTSIILILLAAIALIFFAVTLNWGRMTQIKSSTSTAATTAAASMVSNIASYGEEKIQQELDGKLKNSELSTIVSALIKLAVVIGAVVAIALAPQGLPWYMQLLSAVSIGLAAGAIAMQAAYVQPAQSAMWNKQQAALPFNDQFLEKGVQVAAQGIASDGAKIVDYFDSDMDGKFGPASGDHTGRYAYFYTERLNAFNALNTLDLMPFLDGLGLFHSLLTEACPDGPASYGNDPHCNPCCVPLIYQGQPWRAAYCPQDDIPVGCGAAPYPFIYDDTYPDPVGPSLLAKLGTDASLNNPPPFLREFVDQRGIFLFFWDMQHMRDDITDTDTIDETEPVVLKQDEAILASAPDARMTDAVMAMSKYRTPPADLGQCVETQDATQGFLWRKGTDEKCSLQYPYDKCFDCPENVCPVCPPVPPGIKDMDLVDNLAYGLKGFVRETRDLLGQNEILLRAQMEQWYPTVMAPWIGPVCDGSNDLVCNKESAGKPGKLLVLQTTLNIWQARLAAWINSSEPEVNTDIVLAAYTANPINTAPAPPKEFFTKIDNADANAWCVPDDPADLRISEEERNYILGRPPAPPMSIPAEWGSLPSVINCLEYNVNFQQGTATGNQERFQKCAEALDPAPQECKRDIPPICGQFGAVGKFYPCEEKDAVKGVVENNYAPRLAIYLAALADYESCDEDEDEECEFAQPDSAEYDNYHNCLNQIDAEDCPVVPKPFPECAPELPRSLDPTNPPPPFENACLTKSPYTQWVKNSAALATSTGQVDKFRNRLAYLKRIKNEAVKTFGAITDTKTALDNFLSGPVASLIQTRKDYKIFLDKLPSFVVYGWKTPKDPLKPAAPQYWHIVRAEAIMPGKCPPGGPCCTPGTKCVNDEFITMPTKSGWFHRTYELKNYEGRVMIRVTRWDEERQSKVSFNNKVPLWNFRFGKPGQAPASPDGLANCAGKGLFNDISGFEDKDKKELNNAFMLNLPGGDSCWNTVDSLLNQGIKTTACTEYNGKTYDKDGHAHMEVKFIPCPPTAFPDDKTLGNS